MPRLPMFTVQLVVEACLAANVDRDVLLAPLPRAVAASIPTGDTPMKQLYHVLHHLNGLSCPDDDEHPLKAVLQAGKWLAQGFRLTEPFDRALRELSAPAS